MIELTCCSSSNWGSDTTDLGHVDSFDFMLGRCSNCGAYWLNVFCVATNTTGYEPVSNDDARIMLAIPPGPELKAFMKAWSREHI
jgi:hypothetical protein